jgi:hypothetical protein
MTRSVAHSLIYFPHTALIQDTVFTKKPANNKRTRL